MGIEYRAARPSDVPECFLLRGKTRENSISAEGLKARGITVESWAQDLRQGLLPGYVCLADEKLIGFCFGDKKLAKLLYSHSCPGSRIKGSASLC